MKKMKKLYRITALLIAAISISVFGVACKSSSKKYSEVAGTYVLLEAKANDTAVNVKAVFEYYNVILEANGNARVENKLKSDKNIGTETVIKCKYDYIGGYVKLTTEIGNISTTEYLELKDQKLYYNINFNDSTVTLILRRDK